MGAKVDDQISCLCLYLSLSPKPTLSSPISGVSKETKRKDKQKGPPCPPTNNIDPDPRSVTTVRGKRRAPRQQKQRDVSRRLLSSSRRGKERRKEGDMACFLSGRKEGRKEGRIVDCLSTQFQGSFTLVALCSTSQEQLYYSLQNHEDGFSLNE